MNILLLEDDPLNAELVCELLGQAGHAVTHAHSAAEFRALCSSAADVLLMDIMVPDGDGADLLVELRRDGKHRHTPAVALTAQAQSRDVERFRQAGFLSVLTKPIDTRSFVTAVESAAMKDG